MKRILIGLVAAASLLAPVAVMQGASAAPVPSVNEVDRILASIHDESQAEAVLSKLSPAQAKAVHEKILDEVEQGLNTMEWDTSGVEKAQQKVATSAKKRICAWGRAEARKNILFFEMSGHLYVKVCGTGRVKTGLTNEVAAIESDITITLPGIVETFKGNSSRIYDNETRARAMARWEIAFVYHGIPGRRTICMQMRLTGWHPPLAPATAGVEWFWPDNCSLYKN